MRDPIKDLENFDEGLTVHPLPASEVRRRGSRMRRRNNALAGIGGLVAVAIIAAPLAIGASGSDRSGSVDPATEAPSATRSASSEPPSWLHRIPGGFPLTEGMPATNGHDGSPVVAEPGYRQQAPIAPCGEPAWTPDALVEAADVEQAVYTGESEGGEDRTLVLYADQDAAHAVFDAIRAPLGAGCPAPSTGIDSTELDSDLGEESLVYVDAYRDRGEYTGEAYLYQVVRTGNALLLSSTYFGGAGDDQIVDETAVMMRDRTAATVGAMCVFAAEPCGPPTAPTGSASSTGSTGEGAVPAIPDDFPILEGYPADNSAESGSDGLQGPTRDGTDLTFEACGVAAPAPDGVEQLNGGWTNPEDVRSRQLTTFATVAEAEAFVDGILEVYRDCPTEDTDDGYTSVRSVVDGSLGDRSASAVLRYEMQGTAAPGLDVTTVVRVGRAVLVATTYREAGVGPHPGREVDRAVAADRSAVSTLVAAMCTFTERGC